MRRQKSELKMRRKRGYIPRRVWNALVEEVWANRITSFLGGEMRQTTEGTRLEVRHRPPGGGAGTHPFKITVAQDGATWTATVGPGVAHAPQLYQDMNGWATPMMLAVQITETVLTGLADNTSYGMWLEGTAAVQEQQNEYRDDSINTAIGGPYYVLGYAPTPYLVDKDATNTEASDVFAKVAAEQGSQYAYIGKVTIADGVVSIDQWVQENIYMAMATWGHGVIDNKAGNVILTGDDGGVFYEP